MLGVITVGATHLAVTTKIHTTRKRMDRHAHTRMQSCGVAPRLGPRTRLLRGLHSRIKNFSKPCCPGCSVDAESLVNFHVRSMCGPMCGCKSWDFPMCGPFLQRKVVSLFYFKRAAPHSTRLNVGFRRSWNRAGAKWAYA